MPNLKGYFDKGVLKQESVNNFIAEVSGIVQDSLSSASVNSYKNAQEARGFFLANESVKAEFDAIGQQSSRARLGQFVGKGGSGEKAAIRQEAFIAAVDLAVLNLVARQSISLREQTFEGATDINDAIRNATANVYRFNSEELAQTALPQAPVRARPQMPLPPEANVYMTPTSQIDRRAAETDPIYAVADDTRRLRWNFRNPGQSSTDSDYVQPQDVIPPGRSDDNAYSVPQDAIEPDDGVYFVPQGAIKRQPDGNSQDPTVGRDNLSSRLPQENALSRPGRPSPAVHHPSANQVQEVARGRE